MSNIRPEVETLMGRIIQTGQPPVGVHIESMYNPDNGQWASILCTPDVNCALTKEECSYIIDKLFEIQIKWGSRKKRKSD